MPRTARGATWKEIAWKPALALAAIPWAVMCGFNAVKGEFFSREFQDKWQLRNLSPWPWWAWALISFAILVGVIGEGAFRAIRKREFQIGGLNEELQKQIQAERQATADFLRRSTEIINLRGEVENKKSEIDGLNSSLGYCYELCGEPDGLRHRAAQLAADILAFLKEKGPPPTYPTGASQHERIEWTIKQVVPYGNVIMAGYSLRFAQRLGWMRDLLSAGNFQDQRLNRALDAQVHDFENLRTIAERLLVLALEIHLTEKGFENCKFIRIGDNP